MRSVRLTTLLMLLVLGPSVYANGRVVKRPFRPGPSPVATPPRAVLQPKEPETYSVGSVEGWGKTREDAEQIALEHARREVLMYFEQRHHPLEWRPNLDYIKKNLVARQVDVEPDGLDELTGPVLGVRLWIEIPADKWQAMQKEDRRERSEFRMLLLGKLLAGFVAFLGAVAGYLRLEEMTKGYYTAWLRLAAIGFVSAVGAGIWWIS